MHHGAHMYALCPYEIKNHVPHMKESCRTYKTGTTMCLCISIATATTPLHTAMAPWTLHCNYRCTALQCRCHCILSRGCVALAHTYQHAHARARALTGIQPQAQAQVQLCVLSLSLSLSLYVYYIDACILGMSMQTIHTDNKCKHTGNMQTNMRTCSRVDMHTGWR